MRIQILILGFKRLSAGVQGLDFALGLWCRIPIMVWIIKNLVCSHYCPVSTVLGQVWTALKPGSHVRRKCKCNSKRRSHVKLKRKEGKIRKRSQGQSNFFQDGGREWSFGRSKSTFRGFPISCAWGTKKVPNWMTQKYTLIRYSVYLIVLTVYIFYRKTYGFLVPWFFCHIFSGKSFLQFIRTTCIIKHRIFPHTICLFLV